MMDFLRSLAPHHGNARHRAVAAVRSRYEADRPMQSMPLAESGWDGSERNGVTEPKSIEGTVPRVVASRISAPHTDTPAEAVRLTVGHVELLDAQQPEPPRTEAHSVIDIGSPSKQVVDVRREPIRDAAKERRRPAALTELVASVPPSRPVFADATPSVPAAASLARAAHPSVPERPLSPQTVLFRVEPPSERRPVVHVTIDRIDVRAPAAPERGVSRSRPRSASSNGSLAEYLRTKQPGRSGGVK